MKPVALVTGASRGIGFETSRILAQQGFHVIMAARGVDVLEAARTVQSSGSAQGIQADVSKPEDISQLRDLVEKDYEALDVLVNNAGIVRRGSKVEDTTVADWNQVLDVNLTGAFLATRAFVGAMKQRRRGRIVFVASISSTIGCPENASYAASKWGMLGLMKSVAEETRHSGVVVTGILPGSVDTEMLKGSGFAAAMSATDVAREIVHLATAAAPALHGSAIEMFG